MTSNLRPLRALQRLLGGASFPAFVVSLLVLQAALSAAVLVVPLSGTALERFAEDFKVWCFGYDREQGTFIWAMVLSFTTAPLAFASVVLFVFGEPLLAAWRSGARTLAPAASAAVIVALAANVGLALGNAPSPDAPLPFPAEALRTAIPAPSFALIDHRGAPLHSANLRGRVVMVTAVYSACATTCPMILSEAVSALAQLTEAERRELTVVAITLDPMRDTPEQLAKLVRERGLGPAFRLATGAAPDVERVLDTFGIARARNPATQLIEHQNVFILIDRNGSIAYRLSSGSRQKHWLGAALRKLLGERAQVALAATPHRR